MPTRRSAVPVLPVQIYSHGVLRRRLPSILAERCLPGRRVGAGIVHAALGVRGRVHTPPAKLRRPRSGGATAPG